VLQLYIGQARVNTLAYSEFKALLKSGNVREVTLGETVLSGTLLTTGVEKILPPDRAATFKQAGQPERVFTAIRGNDPGLVADLDAAHVRYAGQADARWIGTLLSWVVPVLIFFAIWSLLIRRIGGAGGIGGGLMEIGKSKAKVYLQQQTGVTFADVAGIDEAKVELMEVVDVTGCELDASAYQ